MRRKCLDIIKFSITLTVSLFLYIISSAQSNIVITEIMYNPSDDADSLEFIEIYNKGISPVNVLGYQFTKGIDFTFPSKAFNPGEYIVVAYDSSVFHKVFGKRALQWSTGKLSNSGELIVLKNNLGTVLDSVRYSDTPPWPLDADGEGPSLTLCDPNNDNYNPASWTASTEFAGIFNNAAVLATPGTGCLTPDVDTIPPYVKDAFAAGLSEVKVVFSEPVSNSAENVVNYTGLGTITSAVRSASLDTVSLELGNPLTNGVKDTLTISNISDTTVNANTMIAQQSLEIIYGYIHQYGILITEIMYNPPGDDSLSSIEFIELYNISNSLVDLENYSFTNGITYTFYDVSMNPGDYLVIVRDSLAFYYFFGISAYQWTSGGLSNGGEDIVLRNQLGIIIDSVRYDDDLLWAPEADGNGSSLTLCNYNIDNSLPYGWYASTEYVGMFNGMETFASPGSACTPDNIEIRTKNNNAYVSIYPNPCNGNLNIITGNEHKYTMKVFSVIGELIYSRIIQEPLTQISLNERKGVYIIQFTDSENKTLITKKIIVQ